eukprot:2699136-Pleurochrysis_carterae.AAC.1
MCCRAAVAFADRCGGGGRRVVTIIIIIIAPLGAPFRAHHERPVLSRQILLCRLAAGNGVGERVKLRRARVGSIGAARGER